MKIEAKSYKSLSGEGSVAVSPGPVVDISLHGTGQQYRFHGEQIGQNAFIPAVGSRIQSANVRLSEDARTLWGLAPWKGSFFGKFSKFAAKDGELPQWKVQKGGKRTGANGTWYAKDKPVFTAVFQVNDQVWGGCDVVTMFDYIFEMDEDGNTKLVGSEKSKHFRNLVNFLEVCGFDFQADNLKYSDNILPQLETILQARQRPVLLVVEDGWIKDISLPPVGMSAQPAPVEQPVAQQVNQADPPGVAPAPSAPIQPELPFQAPIQTPPPPPMLGE